MVNGKNRKLALSALDKVKAVICESLKDNVTSASLFVIDEFEGKTDEELINGYFSHKFKLALERLAKVNSSYAASKRSDERRSAVL